MARQYKLRLGDGTVLAVDQQALTTWLLDDKAMVQLPGSNRWRSLKLVAAEEAAAAAAAPARPVEPPPIPRVEPEHVEPPPLPVSNPEPVAPPRRFSTTDVVTFVPRGPAEAGKKRPKEEDEGEALWRAAASPPAEPKPAPKPPPVVEAPVVPPPPPPKLAPIAEVPVAPPPPPPQPAIEFRVASPKPPAVSPLAELPAIAEKALAGGGSKDDGLPAIPLKPLDDDERVEQNALPELELVEEPPAAAPGKPPAKVVEDVVNVMAAAISAWYRVVCTCTKRARGTLAQRMRTFRARASSPAAAAEPWTAIDRPQPLTPPPPLAELPVLRLAPLADEPAPVVFGETPARAWMKRAVLVGGLAAAATVGVVAAGAWLPNLIELVGSLSGGGVKESAAHPPVAATVGEPAQPALSKEMQTAVQQLPHLTPDTIQLVVLTSPFGPPENPEVFRRAHFAAQRGASALSEQETQELAALQAAVLANLRPNDRARVRAYDRVRAGRDLLSAEDAKVSGHYARGARALPPRSRQRLQVLLGKAIGAALAPPPGTKQPVVIP